jgi:hypothetical protein
MIRVSHGPIEITKIGEFDVTEYMYISLEDFKTVQFLESKIDQSKKEEILNKKYEITEGGSYYKYGGFYDSKKSKPVLLISMANTGPTDLSDSYRILYVSAFDAYIKRPILKVICWVFNKLKL